MKIKLETSELQYKRLCEDIDGRGRVTLSKGVVRRLIVDHSKILAALHDLGIEVQYQRMKGG